MFSPSLTITAGLRWDIFGGKTERHNRLEYFDPTAVGTSGPVGNFPRGQFHRRRSICQQRQPFSVYYQPEEL